MRELLPFIGIVVILGFEGFALARLIDGKLNRWIRIALAIPLASIANVFLIFVFTVLHIPLIAVTMIGGHVLMTAGLWFITRKSKTDEDQMPNGKPKPWLLFICAPLIAISLGFGMVHAVFLPSIAIDVFTNWTMRSEISFEDHALAFDTNETRGMAKPQYPPLLHGLQITANELQPKWNDRAANAVVYLLIVSMLASLGLLIARARTWAHAFVCLTLLLQLPLLSIQLSEGYGDLPLALWTALSLATLALALENPNRRFFFLSALFVSAALWTKSEGTFAAFAPWALTLFFVRKELGLTFQKLIFWIVGTFLTFVPFYFLLLAKGLPLTPHESDNTFGIHWDGIAVLPGALFSSGCFGILWTACLISIPIMLWSAKKNHPLMTKNLSLLCIFGLSCFAVVVATYTLTPNVVFLLNAQSFYRQLLTPAALLLVWGTLMMRKLQESA